MADVRIRFRADGKQAQQQINALQGEMGRLQQSTRRVTREALEFRQEMQRLDRVNAELRQGLIGADAAERKRIQGFISANNTTKSLIRTELQRLSIQKQSIALQAQETRTLLMTEKGFRQAGQAGGRFSGVLSNLGGVLGAIGIGEFVYRLTDFVRASARASVEIDSNTRALATLTGSAAEAERAIAEIQALADEPGLQFRQAVQGTVALRAIGTEAETTTRILRELANAAAFSGQGGEFERGLLGFRQIIQRGRVSQEELNQLTENLGLVSKAIREEFGTVLAEDIQAQLESTGQTIDDFVQRTLTALERLERFPLDAPSVKLKNLSNSFFEFQAAVGDQFLPVIASGAEGLTRFFDGLTEFISNTNVATKSVENFTTAITAADTAIGRDDAIQNRIRFLREYIAELEEAQRQRGIFDNRGRTIAQGEIESEQTELGRLERIAVGDPEIIRELTAEVQRLDEALVKNEDTLTSVERTANRFSESQSRNFDIRRQNLQEEADALFAQRELRESELQSAQEAAGGVADAEREKIQASEEATAQAEAAAQAAQAQTDALIAQIQAARQTRENLEALAEGQETLNDFWRIARGDVQAYSDAVDLARISIVNHAAEVEALNKIFEESADPFAQYIEEFGTDSDSEIGTLVATVDALSRATREYAISQEIANAEARLVNPAISEAVERLRDYNTSLENQSGALVGNFERLREYGGELESVSVDYRSLADISADVTDSIRDQTSAFDELSTSVDGVALITRQGPGSFIANIHGELLDINDALDMLDTEIQAIPTDVDLLGDAFLAMGDNAAGVLDQLIGEFSQLDGVVGDLGTKIGQFDIAGLATGNPQALAALPFQLYNAFTFDQRQADAALPGLDRQYRAAFERGEFGIPTDLLAFGRGRLDVAAGVVGQSPFGDRQLLELLDALDPVIGSTTLDEVARIPERIEETILDYTGRLVSELGDTLEQSQFNLDFAQSLGQDTADAYQTLIEDTTAFYQAQIDAINLVRQATGNLSFGDPEGLARQLQEETNALRLDAPALASSTRYNLSQQIAQGQREGSTEEIARAQYGESAYDAEVAAAEAAAAQVEEDTEKVAEDAAEVLRNVHQFTREENDILGGLRNAVEIARSAVNRLDEDSTTEEITRAYQELATAEETLFEAQVGFIESAVGITETARTQALAQARISFENRIATANTALVDALEAVGQQLTTTIMDWFSVLEGSALAVQAIPPPVVPEEPPPVVEPDIVSTSLLQNRVQRAQFDLGFATSEEDFETRRGNLLRAITEFYDAELERIAQVAESETELQDLREDNALARDRELQRAKDASNTFAEERIRDEERVAAEQARAAEQQQRDAERQAEQEARQAERQRQEAERQAEQERRERERAAQEAEREAARQAQEAERARRESISQAGALDRNRVDRARFALSLSGSEAEFERNRRALMRVINEFYDNEIARIEELGGAEADLQDAREDAELARQRALRQAEDANNTFTAERIRNEQEVLRETERSQQEQERSQQEQERIAARAAQERLRQEERLQDDIDKLRDDQLENERDREQELIELAEDTARRKLEIEEEFQEDLDDLRTRRNRTQEDIEQEFTRDLEDALREAGASEDLFTHGDFQSIRNLAQAGTADNLEQVRQLASLYGADLDSDALGDIRDAAVSRQRDQQDLSRDYGSLIPGSAGFDFYRRQLESGQLTDEKLIEQLFGRRGLDEFIGRQRDIEDVEQRAEQQEADINAQAEATALALQTALEPLLNQTTPTAMLESETAEKVATTAEMESTTATTAAETALVESQTADVAQSAMDVFSSAMAPFETGASDLAVGALALKELDLGLLNESLEAIPTAILGLQSVFGEASEQFKDLLAPLLTELSEVQPRKAALLPLGLGGSQAGDAGGSLGNVSSVSITAESVSVSGPMQGGISDAIRESRLGGPTTLQVQLPDGDLIRLGNSQDSVNNLLGNNER